MTNLRHSEVRTTGYENQKGDEYWPSNATISEDLSIPSLLCVCEQLLATWAICDASAQRSFRDGREDQP